jgi:hypothetical protein
MFRDSLIRVFDLEGGFLHTLVALSVRPGQTVREYVAGRRGPLTHPVSYCFLLVTLYALTINLLDVQISLGGALEFSDTERRVFHVVHSLLAYLIFLTLWPVAAIQRRLFRDSGFALAETYAFCLYVFGHLTLVGAVFAASRLLASTAGLAALLLIQLLYLLWAMKGFYRLTRPPFLRALAVSAASLVVTNLLSWIVGNLLVATGLLEQVESILA